MTDDGPPRDNRWGAFVPGPRAQVAPLGKGPLDGLRLAVKDLIDVAGVVTTGGNPDWARTHGAATRHASAVQRLLMAGAHVVGKTVTDELAFGLEGENVHHGTPRQPLAPDRLPGGSSSGSAVAVAAGQADIALGTDTGGSVRVPAAFCGVFGFRPSHGRVSLDGVLPFAPDYDTVGWMARTGAALDATGQVLLDDNKRARGQLRLHWSRTLAALADEAVRRAVVHAARQLPMDAPIDDPAWRAQDHLEAYVALQGAQIRGSLGGWIAQHQPVFGAAIAQRFAGLADVAEGDVARWQVWRQGERQRIDAVLGQDHGWVFPTVHCPALPLSSGAAERGAFYRSALAINAVAGHGGLPQITLPAGMVGGAPLGLSILGPRGSDEALLAIGAAWVSPIPSPA
jgi:amidase